MQFHAGNSSSSREKSKQDTDRTDNQREKRFRFRVSSFGKARLRHVFGTGFAET